MTITEAQVEQAAIEVMEDLGYGFVTGPTIAPGGEAPERTSYAEVILADRFRSALARINPHLGPDALEDAARTLLSTATPDLVENNIAFHRHLARGIELQVQTDHGTRGDLAQLVDFANPANNDWLVVNQMAIRTQKNTRRPDLVVFLNGLPVAVIEIKDPTEVDATIEKAWNQLQTYKTDIPELFETNAVLVITDGTEAKVGSLTAGFERFGPWRTIDGDKVEPDKTPKMPVLLRGVFEQHRFLDYIRHFIMWEVGDKPIKKIAGYHQFHAANRALAETIRASRPDGNKRIGVVWHTQGSGKSISAVFYTAKLILHPEMANPTVVVLTDRNDLDGQLFAQFCAAKDLIPIPEQADDRDNLKELLDVASGGLIFTTIQKFGTAKGQRYPKLSDRRNIVVIADEAHRSQYEFTEGFARNLRDALPNASFIGFTGTPITFDDKNTYSVFGDEIHAYTVMQAVEDGATVPIHYEARLAKINLGESAKAEIDDKFEEVTEAEETSAKEKLKSRWAKLEAMFGTEERIALVAQDIVEHFERRTEIIVGKAMVVSMSRPIAVWLYDAIVKLRPEWHADDDDDGAIKVVMTGAADDEPFLQKHVRTKAGLKAIEKRFKHPEDPLKMVIVRDMWLTGFDAPCAHTLYVDKPMKGHGLMQAIARVNRVFRDKPAGLVVDYLGLAEDLRKAVTRYGSEAPGEAPTVEIEKALEVLLEKFEVVKAMFHGFDYEPYFTGQKQSERLDILAAAGDHVIQQDEGKKRFLDAVAALTKAAGIALHLDGARDMRDEIGLFQAVGANLRKYTVTGKSTSELNSALRQIVSEAVASDGVIDIYGAAGITKPDISVLSDAFLETVQKSPYPNLQLEVLKKLLNDEIKAKQNKNVVKARQFSEMLEGTLLRYQNRTLEAAQIILELIDLAKQMREDTKRPPPLDKLTDDEVAFYDALADHGDVKNLMDDQVLAAIAHDLVEAIRASVTIDWTQKEAVRADMRRKVKRLLRRHGYPPDKREQALATVLEQAEVVCRDWATAA